MIIINVSYLLIYIFHAFMILCAENLFVLMFDSIVLRYNMVSILLKKS